MKNENKIARDDHLSQTYEQLHDKTTLVTLTTGLRPIQPSFLIPVILLYIWITF